MDIVPTDAAAFPTNVRARLDPTKTTIPAAQADATHNVKNAHSHQSPPTPVKCRQGTTLTTPLQ